MSAPYKAGTIALTGGSAIVAGTGCDWLTGAPVLAGDILFAAGSAYPVASVDSATQITLDLPYEGAGVTNIAYAILPSPQGFQVASAISQSVADLNDMLRTRLAGFVPLDATKSGDTYRVVVPGVIAYRADVPVYWRPPGPNTGASPKLRWGDLPPLTIFKDRTGKTFAPGEINQHGVYLTIWDTTLDGGAGGHIVVGPEGPPGRNGSIIYRLESAPQPSDFIDGDYVIEVDSSGSFVSLFGPKLAGVWPPGIDLSAPAAVQAAAAAGSAAAALSYEQQAASSAAAAGSSASSAATDAGNAAASAVSSSSSADSAAGARDQALLALQAAETLANGLLVFDDGLYDFDGGATLDDGFYNLG